MQHQAIPARKDDGGSAWRSLPGLRGGIGLRLLVRVLLFSLAITLLLTLVQLYLDYRRDVRAIDQRISEIDSGYRRSLGEGLWRLDANQLQLQAEGILHLPDIHYVELREATDRAAPLIVTAGSREDNPPTRREFRIYYTNRGAEQLVGTLVVEATFDRIYRELLDTAAVILAGQAIMTFIVSFFVLLIVDRLITRHLTGIATSLRGYDLHGSPTPLRLDRRRQADELDRLVEAFNDMYARLQVAYGDLAEREKHLTATSEVLRTIANAPSDLRSALDAVAEHAAGLCGASNARIWRLEDNVLRLVATYGESSATMDGREGLPADRDTVTGRAACDRRTVHVHDIAAEDREYPLGSRIVKGQGWHTTLATPLLREGTPVGTILVRRMEVRPFDDQQIALLETFADQAAIAIENVRLFEAEKQRTLALADANRDLAEREAKIRRLVDSNIIGIFVWDFDGRILEANDEFLRMLSYDREELASGRMKWTDLTPPDWREQDNAKIEQHKIRGRLEPFEKEYTRRDGSRVPVLIGVATFEEGGKQGVAFVVDLTERKCAEHALREREAQLAEARRELRQMIDTIPIPVASYSADARRDFVNAAWKHYTGLSDEAARGTEWSVVAHPDDTSGGDKMWRDALATGEPWHTEERVRRADGQYRWFAIDRVAARDENGKIIKWYGTAYDIEDRKRAEERLRVQHRVAQILAEAATIEEATPRILRAMGECLGWDVGVLWRVDQEAEALRCVELWHKTSIEVPEFERVSREFTFVPGLGLPGRVWSSLEAEYVPDVVPDENFPRGPIAEREGLHAAFGFPILLGGEALGVIEFFSREIRQPDQDLLDMLATVGSQIGQFIERKDAEDALRESEYKLRQIVETVPSLLWSTDPGGKVTHVNQRMLDYSGMQLEEFRHRGWEAFVHPADYPATTEAFCHAIQTGTSYQGVMRLRQADGEFRWHHARCEPLHDRQGNIIQWYGLCFDIDEGKKAEDLLRRSEAHLAEAQRLSHTGAVAYNGKAILFASEETYHIWGFDPAQGLPSREVVFQRIHPGDRDWLSGEVRRAVGEKRRFSIAYRILLPDGTVKHLETIGQPLFSASGKLVEIFATQTDVTERKRAEEALRSAIDGIAGLVSILAPNGEVEAANRQFLEYFGRSLEWIKNWEANDTLHPEDLHRVAEVFKTAIVSGIPFNFELRLRRFDGEYRWFDTRGVPIRDDSGRIVRWYNLLTDIEDGKRALARLEQMQSDFAHVNRVSMMGELVASLSHEIAQPMASTRINARAAQNFLDMRPPDLGEVREALAGIVGQADRAGDIIDRIRDQIRKAPPRKERFDLNEAINEVIVLGRNAIIKNRVWVQTRLAEGPCPVHGDRVQLQQVVLNLFLNAVEAMGTVESAPRDLLISTRQDRTGVLVAVHDSGPGIHPEHLDRVFNSFYTTKPSGTGIGLSICRSIIDAHGGRLWAEANEPRGAIFQFTLPAA